jgi:Flp pilus assembly protein CpaB
LKRSNRLVLLIGIFLAIVAFVLVVLTLGPKSGDPNAPSAAPTTTKIVVAAKDIPLSTKIAADDLKYKDIAIADKPADAFVDTSFVIGQIARQAVSTDQYISTQILGTSNGVIQTIECPAGLVCIAVQVDQVSGVGTLTKAGDHVDMIVGLTADKFPVVTLDDEDLITVVAGLNNTSVKALLQGLQVVGTLLPPPPADTGTDPNASPTTTGGSTSLTGQQQIVILAGTTQQAEVIKYAQLDGSISLVLRATADFVDPVTGDPLPPETIVPVTTTGITLKTLVDDYGVLVPELVEAILPNQGPRP